MPAIELLDNFHQVLMQQNEALRLALKRYGQHDTSTCDAYFGRGECSCGLKIVLTTFNVQ